MSVFFALCVHDNFLMYICYRHACRNVGSEKLAGRGCTCVPVIGVLFTYSARQHCLSSSVRMQDR